MRDRNVLNIFALGPNRHQAICGDIDTQEFPTEIELALHLEGVGIDMLDYALDTVQGNDYPYMWTWELKEGV